MLRDGFNNASSIYLMQVIGWADAILITWVLLKHVAATWQSQYQSTVPNAVTPTEATDNAKIYITIRSILEYMSEIVLQVPDDALLALKMSRMNWERELRLAAAVKLFELGRLPSGAAAGLAGIPRTLFLTRLASYGVDTFRLTEEDLWAEATLA